MFYEQCKSPDVLSLICSNLLWKKKKVYNTLICTFKILSPPCHLLDILKKKNVFLTFIKIDYKIDSKKTKDYKIDSKFLVYHQTENVKNIILILLSLQAISIFDNSFLKIHCKENTNTALWWWSLKATTWLTASLFREYYQRTLKDPILRAYVPNRSDR